MALLLDGRMQPYTALTIFVAPGIRTHGRFHLQTASLIIVVIRKVRTIGQCSHKSRQESFGARWTETRPDRYWPAFSAYQQSAKHSRNGCRGPHVGVLPI